MLTAQRSSVVGSLAFKPVHRRTARVTNRNALPVQTYTQVLVLYSTVLDMAIEWIFHEFSTKSKIKRLKAMSTVVLYMVLKWILQEKNTKSKTKRCSHTSAMSTTVFTVAVTVKKMKL